MAVNEQTQNDGFYTYPQSPSTPWQSVNNEAFAPMSPMEFGYDEAVSSSGLGFYFYFADGTELFIARSTVLDGYDSTTDTDWSIVFPVSGGAINTGGTITYDATTTLYDAVGDQTFYRLPVIRGVDFGDGLEPQTLSLGGVYRENIFCDASNGLRVELIKIA